MQRPTPLFILSLSATLFMLGVGMIVALLPQRVHDLTGSLESVGLIASLFALTYLLAQFAIGTLSDRIGPRRFLIAGYLLCAASGVVFASAGTAGGIFLGRAIQGLGEAPVWALGPAMLALAYPGAKGRVIGFYNAAIHAGLMAGPLLGLLIAPEGQGRLPFLAFALASLIAGLNVLVFLRSATGSSGRSRASLGQFLRLLRRRSALILLLGVLLYGAGYGVFVTILPVSLAAHHGFGPGAVSLFFVLFYAAISLSQIVAGPLSDTVGRSGFLIWGMALAAAGLAVFPFMPGLGAYLPLAVAGVGLGMFCVASIAELNEVAPDSLKGAVSGSYYFFWGAGYMLGPLAIGAVGSASPSLAFTGLAALFAVQALAGRLLRD